MYIDDVLVVQQLAPPPKPPSPPPPTPPMTPVLLFQDFETLPLQPWPSPAPGTPEAAPYTKLAAPVHAVLLDAPLDGESKDGKMTAEVPSRDGYGGGKGAMLDVKTSYKPAWRARLELGKFVVHLERVTITLWAKATARLASAESVSLPVDVTDESDGGRWLGSPHALLLTSTWAPYNITVVLDPLRRLHYISFALIVGGTAATYSIDDVKIEQSLPPKGLRDGQLFIGFEDGESEDAVNGGLAMLADPSAPAGAIVASKSTLHSPIGERDRAMPSGGVSADGYRLVAPSGQSCAKVTVKQALTPAWHAKLRLGTFRAVNQTMTIQLSARAEPPSRDADTVSRAPSAQLTVDVNYGTEWLGHWVKFNLSATEWRRLEANVTLPIKLRGQLLDVSIVLGHRAATYLIDDVSITQGLAPPAAPTPPPIAWGATYDFERPKGPSGVVELQTSTPAAADVVYADTHSPLAGRAGGHGAMVTVTEATAHPWHARLGLGWFEAQRGMLAIRLSGKLAPAPPGAKPPPPPPPFPPLPPPTGLEIKCTQHNERDTKKEACMSWCADVKSPADGKCKYCKCKSCPVCRIESQEPYVTISVTDLDNSTEWLGYWQRFNLSAGEWRRFEADILLPPTKRGHTLDVAVVVGHVAATFLIDDIVILQRDPPSSAAGLAIDFEEPDATVVPKMPPSPIPVMTANLGSAAAAHSGRAGAEISLSEVVSPAWEARLEFGALSAAFNALTVSFWAKARDPVAVHVNVLDATRGYTWIAFWQQFNITTQWARHTAVAELPSTSNGHVLQASFVLGGSDTTYFIDDITLQQSCANWPTPWLPQLPSARLETSFEDCSMAQPAFELGDVGGATGDAIEAELYSQTAARTGRFGARLNVKQPLPAGMAKPKLRLGTLRLASADRASDAALLSFWVRLQPGDKGEKAAEHDGGLVPSVSFEMLDINASYTWIGFWRPCNLTHGAWTKCAAEVMVAPTLADHDVQISLVFAGVKASYLLDDVQIVQRHLTSAAEAADQHVLVSEDFEALTRPPPPVSYGPNLALKLPTRPPAAVVAAATASVDLHSSLAHATKKSTSGALVRVPVFPTGTDGQPVGNIGLSLGKFHGVAGSLTVTVWAKAAGLGAGPRGLMAGGGVVSLEVLDEADGYKWLGAAEKKTVGSTWKQISISADIPGTAEGHLLQVALVFDGAAQYLLDELTLTCPTRLYETIVNVTFETSDAVPLKPYVQKTPATEAAAAAAVSATGGRLSANDLAADLTMLEAPSTAGAHTGTHGALLRLNTPFTSPSDAKLRLTKLTAVHGTVNVSLWVKALPGAGGAATPSKKKKKTDGARELAETPSGPFVSVDVLDETTGFEWLGAWQRTAISSTKWTYVEALIFVDAARAGHSLDAALVVGGAYPGVLIDDVIVSAPPIIGAGCVTAEREPHHASRIARAANRSPPAHPLPSHPASCLTIAATPSRPVRRLPVRAMTLSFESEDAVSHIGVVHTGGGKSGGTLAGGGTSVRTQLRSPHAALSGHAGAMFNVLSPLAPPAAARLVLCLVTTALPGTLKVVFWARTPSAHPAPRVSVDLFDTSDRWEWLGSPDDFKLTTTWQRIEVTHQLSAARVGHKIEVGVQLGRAAGIILIDDLEVWAPRSAEGVPPRIMPPVLPVEAPA